MLKSRKNAKKSDLQLTASMIRLLTVGGTPFDAIDMQTYFWAKNNFFFRIFEVRKENEKVSPDEWNEERKKNVERENVGDGNKNGSIIWI